MSNISKNIFVLILVVSIGSGVEWDGFVGKFAVCIFCTNGFYDLPTSLNEALNSNPAFVDTHVKDPEFNVKVLCIKDDPHVCLLFDNNGNLAGLRVSHLKSEVTKDLSKFPFKYDKVSIFTSANFLGYDLWYTNFLFTNPENLKAGGPGRVNTDETAEGLWIRLSDGWTEIPRDECVAEKKGLKKQGFIPWMGNHHTIGQTEDCSTLIPVLPIYNKGRLMAVSFAPIGKHTIIKRDWFETVPHQVIPRIVPDGYKPCLQKQVEEFSASGFHFYFIKNPRIHVLLDRSPKCNP